MESPEAQLGDTAGTQLTLALAYSVYTLKENKRLGWGEFKGGEGGSRSNKTSPQTMPYWAFWGVAMMHSW